MYYLHVTRNLRSIAFVLIAGAIFAALGTLWWANHTGLPESWRAAIEKEISKQGAHVKIGGLSYLPFRGVVATRIRIFSDPAYQHEISRLERVLLDFDKTKFARGDIHLTKVELKDAALTMQVDPKDPDSQTLEISKVNGTLLMPGGRRFEVRNASGTIGGIQVNLNSRIIGYKQNGQGPRDDDQMGKRRALLAQVIGELNQWHFNTEHPPELKVFIEADANDRSALLARFSLRAKDLEKNQYRLSEVSAEAEIAGDLLTVTDLNAMDSRGNLTGHMDYDIGDKEGRFDIRSSLEIPQLLSSWLGLPPVREVLIGGEQLLEAEGDFRLDDHNQPQARLTGNARCESVMFRGIQFNTVASAFSWRDGNLFLRDLIVKHPGGEARGKAMIQWPLVRMALDTTLPIAVYRPLFIGQPLEIVLNDFTERKGVEVHVTLEGGFDATDPHSWAYTGQGYAKNINYKGVPLNSAESKFSLSHHELDFTDGTVVFNYQNYALREAFNGTKQGTTKVARIRFDAQANIVEVENVNGTVWAAPLVRMFAPKVADTLEIYRFHQPPELKGSGVVDVTPQGRTSLDISFKSDAAADYRFLGENLTLSKPGARVAIRGERVTVNDLTLNAFDGPIAARFDFRGKGKITGDISWTRLSIPALSSTYGFEMKSGGNFTGRLDFSLTDGRVETMDGDGLFALEKTELFSVPMFGPLSPLMSGVLNDRRAGFERAKNAFCTFKIKDGILTSNDFRTATTSLTFGGDGTVNLKDRTLDMTMRVNARGLLGLITLPLRPFYGMFQFRGTGPLKDTKWENVMFTTPPEEQKDLLQAPPKAKIISESE